MLKQIADLLIDSLPFSGQTLGRFRSRSAPAQLRLLGRHLFADLRHRLEHLLHQFLENVELADLMRHARKQLRQRLRVQIGAIGSDALERQIPLEERPLEGLQEERMSSWVGS